MQEGNVFTYTEDADNPKLRYVARVWLKETPKPTASGVHVEVLQVVEAAASKSSHKRNFVATISQLS